MVSPVLVIAYFMFFFGIPYAVVMLISPRSWARLPRWIGGPSRRTADLAATQWGRFWVRLSGAGFLVTAGWFLRESLLLHRY